MKTLYYHEDDYRQIELVPIENEVFVQKEIKYLLDEEDENGISPSDLPTIELSEYKISSAELDAILSSVAVKSEKVTTGYSTYIDVCDDAMGYCLHKIRIYFEFKDEYVTCIWFDLPMENEREVDDLYKILKPISQKYDLLFVHWTNCGYSRMQTETDLKKRLIEIYREE